ncbi:MAG: TRAP transporter small permease [Alphaproteobacteria bacterium]|nr:TRAP transporter small permease [Alphaproteobacteria bacterium]MCW5739993.1 TRAP transporter small permease [Alphaproteobacteria bacterium]
METIWNATARISRLCACIGGILLLAAAVLVSAEVISRKLLTVVYSGSDEIAAYLFAVGTTWSLAYVLVTRGHVRIDALYARLPLRVRAALDIVALLALGIVAYTLLDSGFRLVEANFVEGNRANTPLRTPLALPQIPWLFGLGLFFFSIIVATLRTLAALRRSDYVTANRTAGVVSQDEEIESELAELGIASARRPGADLTARPTDDRR